MKKLVVSLLVLGGSIAANADGLEAAEKVCSKLYYSNEKQECLAAVQKATYLDERAVEVCGKLYYANETIQCLAAIKDMKYTETAIGLCKKEYYAKDAIACFAKSGRATEAKKNDEAVDKAYVRSSLRKALKAIQDRDSRKAEQIIENLIDTL